MTTGVFGSDGDWWHLCLPIGIYPVGEYGGSSDLEGRLGSIVWLDDLCGPSVAVVGGRDWPELLVCGVCGLSW